MNGRAGFEKLRQFNAEIRKSDKGLAEEALDMSGEPALTTAVERDPLAPLMVAESIVLRRFRPVLAIKQNTTELVFDDPAESTLWEARLRKAARLLEPAIRAVGRIDLAGARLRWVGTGWLVSENVIVTNRHVADVFAVRSGEGFTFKMGQKGQIGASVDFLHEIGNDDQIVFKLVRPLHIEPSTGPDIALFEIEIASGDNRLAVPIRLARNPAITNEIAVIGYPAYDSRIPEPELMERIFGRIYDVKRLAPGGITKIESTVLQHNCTTLGGNSGSVVVDLDSGEAFGLHFSGSFLATNYAVRSNVIAKILNDLRTGRSREEPHRIERGAPPPDGPPLLSSPIGRGMTVTVPLQITISLGAAGEVLSLSGDLRDTGAVDTDAAEIATEAPAGDYLDRKGYQATFLGSKHKLDLPTVSSSDDVLELDDGSGSELKYEHYSVVMSRKRRMCIFSAVNIDGGALRKSARVAWKWDPRIPKTAQIMHECYGNPPKFSRGHMTRREDPGWGDPTTARRGNQDSMHVTNVVPQMQAFNAPIWLALEDYALGHAREDNMKISVFTGPYFKRNDPTVSGVRIPVAFWKVIAFIHDDTGRLCATGYEMTQKQSLGEEEFVFGSFMSPQQKVAAQVPISSIETKSGLSFGGLSRVDPIESGRNEAAENATRLTLHALEEIRFIQRYRSSRITTAQERKHPLPFRVFCDYMPAETRNGTGRSAIFADDRR